MATPDFTTANANNLLPTVSYIQSKMQNMTVLLYSAWKKNLSARLSNLELKGIITNNDLDVPDCVWHLPNLLLRSALHKLEEDLGGLGYEYEFRFDVDENSTTFSIHYDIELPEEQDESEEQKQERQQESKSESEFESESEHEVKHESKKVKVNYQKIFDK